MFYLSVVQLKSNSLQVFSLHEKNSNECQELCFQKGHNWNDLDFSKKRGSLIIKNTYVNGERAEIDDNMYQIYEDGELFEMEWIELKSILALLVYSVIKFINRAIA